MAKLEPGWDHKLDELLYRLRGMGAAVSCIGALVEEIGCAKLGDADTGLRVIGETIATTAAEVRAEVCRITGQTF